MSNNRLVIDSSEFQAGMRQLLESVEGTGEAGHIVEGEANAAAVEVRTGYGRHRRTGNLQEHVVVQHTPSAFGAQSTVKSTAKHAHIFEIGSQARHTSIGANRGSMPPGHVFVPAVVKARRRMYERLKDLLKRHGLLVTGDA